MIHGQVVGWSAADAVERRPAERLCRAVCMKSASGRRHVETRSEEARSARGFAFACERGRSYLEEALELSEVELDVGEVLDLHSGIDGG